MPNCLTRVLIAVLAFVNSASVSAHGVHVEANQYKAPDKPVVIGEGEFRYRLVPNWAHQNRTKYALGEGKAIVEDKAGKIYYLTDSAKHCVIIMSASGDVIDAWGDFASSAHGLNIAKEGNREVLYISENRANGKVFKTTLAGKILLTVSCPIESGLYPDPGRFRPAETVPLPDGGFFVLDGYGSDYILRFDSAGKFVSAFGGDLGQGEAQIKHWGPHGANLDLRNPKNPLLVIGLSDQETIKRFHLDGRYIDTIDLPGGNPRDIYFHRKHIFVPHLGDHWPQERNHPGYISVLNDQFHVVANLGAPPAIYRDGRLKRMTHNQHLFHHPHALLLAKDGSLYVAQDASNRTWPLKFRPIE